MIIRCVLAAAAISSLSVAAMAQNAPSSAGNSTNTATPAAAPTTVTVEIKMFAFTPNILTVSPGTTVTWTNVDEEPHTVTAVEGAFHSTALDTDDKYSFTFSTPGHYAYFCRLHPQMTARVIVKVK